MLSLLIEYNNWLNTRKHFATISSGNRWLFYRSIDQLVHEIEYFLVIQYKQVPNQRLKSIGQINRFKCTRSFFNKKLQSVNQTSNKIFSVDWFRQKELIYRYNPLVMKENTCEMKKGNRNIILRPFCSVVL